ncbi:M48 family metallopeptidase [Pseudogemmobacter sonorensis]|uniref:M48 family metallopeptidase n=1 Tax=Pseudogemmobacter sonorensis TaxID=2989681 RepID=UPI0036C0771C
MFQPLPFPRRRLARLAFLPILLLMAASLAACVPQAASRAPGGGATAAMIPTASGRALAPGTPVIAVVARTLPVAEAMCRAERAHRRCDFVVAVDDDPAQPANAFQTIDPEGRPIIVFTAALLAEVRSADELAFVLGHEAAHHIAGHIGRRQSHARTGAIMAGIWAQISGLDREGVARAQELAAGLAAQQYSKEFELEADALGAEVSWRAGYDPVRGAGFFTRLPDPGDHVLGSHPPNAQRQAVVADAVRRLEGTGFARGY